MNREFAAEMSLSDSSEGVFELWGVAGVKGEVWCRGSISGNRGRSVKMSKIALGMSSGKFCLLFINNSRFLRISE